MPAIKIALADFRVRYVGSPTGSAARQVKPYLDQDANAVAGSNFMYFSSPTSPTINEGLVGQLILSGKVENPATGKNIDTISQSNTGAILFHTESTALPLASSLIWSMAAGPHILRGGNLYNATWANRTGLRQTDAIPRVALGVNSTGMLVLAYRDAVTLVGMSDYMKSLDCKDATVGDSGGSARLYLKDTGAGSIMNRQ